MNIISTILPVSRSENRSVFAVFALVDFLRQAVPSGPGWVVAGSGNGSLGGMGSDVISSVSDLDGNTDWVVLENPDASLQLLFGKTGSETWQCYMNPNADYAGGNATTRPASATSFQYYGTESLWDDTNGNGVVTITADADAPYGFALYGFLYADDTGTCGIAVIPLDDAYRNPDVYKYLVTAGDNDTGAFTYSMMSIDSDAVLTNPRIRGVNVAGTGITNVAGLSPSTVTDGTVIYRCGTSPDSNHVFMPIVWASATQGYYGISSFACWSMSFLQRMSTSGSNDRIVLGDAVFPWDGTTKARRNP